jgi:hypothetical protein
MTNRQRGVGIGATALALAVAGIGVGLTGSDATASTASSHAKTYTQTFVSRDVTSNQLGKSGAYVDFARDVKHGSVIGADSSSGRYHAKSQTVTADMSVERKGGLMFGTFTLDFQTRQLSGTILGGLGKYKGVTGTVSGRALNDKVTRVTIVYHR